jgi:hypothetical protein
MLNGAEKQPRNSSYLNVAAVDEASIPRAMRMAIGLLRDLQSTCMGGDRVQAVLEALDSALDEARELGIRQ